MIRNIRHTGIVIKDLEESMRFYTEILGFEVKKVMDEEGPFISTILGMKDIKVTTIKMTTPDGQMLELLHYPGEKGSQIVSKLDSIGLTHFAITVDDLEMTYSFLKETGISFISEPQISSDGFAKVAFCTDPNNVFIEIVEELKS
jgi:catechol 2,3-dioxygenase-like lactoylglutathione lyase family enzyme